MREIIYLLSMIDIRIPFTGLSITMVIDACLKASVCYTLLCIAAQGVGRGGQVIRMTVTKAFSTNDCLELIVARLI